MKDEYLYEIIENYKCAETIEEKDKIFKNFCLSLWRCKNKRRVYIKEIKFKVKEDLIDTEIGKIFNKYSNIEYKTYKSMTKDIDWCSLIRQKINNLYTNHFDKEVILNTDYINELNKPRDLYYKWLEGECFDKGELIEIIDNSVNNAYILKDKYQKYKMELSWNEYKCVIEDFLQKIFENCVLIDDYEQDNCSSNIFVYDILEDNFYIKYICDSLKYYMSNYQKKYYGLKRGRNKKYKRCKECGKLIEHTNNKKMYCEECAYKKEKERKRKNAYKYRKIKNSEIDI